MNPAAIMYALGSAGPFASRIFLPAFVTALLLRFGGHLPLLAHFGMFAHLHNSPTWFTSNICLIVLGALSVVEILAQKNPEARNLLHELDVYLKTALAVLSSLGVLSATDAAFVGKTAHVHSAGFFGVLVPLIALIGTFRVSTARRDVMLAVFDHLDGTHLDHLISWLEDAWSIFGVFLLILFPILMLILIGIATGILFLLRKRLRTQEEQTKTPCSKCGQSIYACATQCPHCRQPVELPAAIGFLGQSKPYPDNDVAAHPYRLFEKRRCPVCATHLKPRMISQACPDCGETAPRDLDFADAYIHFIGARLPIVLGVSFLLSLIPILGLIAGVVYYRMELVLPFSQYLPLGKRFLLRWGIRLLFLVLIFFQIIPVLGGLVVPLMALISFTAYRSAYRSLLTAHAADNQTFRHPGLNPPHPYPG